MIQLQSLNYLLSSGNTSFADLLKPEYFSEYWSEYTFIKNHYDKFGNIPDQATFLSTFPDFDVLSIKETPDFLISQLKRDKSKRDLIDSYNKMRELVTSDKIEEAVDFMRASSQNVGNEKDVSYINLLDAQSRFDKYLDKCDNKQDYFISTGFKELDDAIGGWDALEELAVIAARTNVGKSQFAIKCATAAVQKGLRVGIYSGEMSTEKVGYRADTMLAHIPNYDLTRGDRRSEVQYRNYVSELPYKYTGAFLCLTPLELGHQATVNDLKNFITDCNLDILFVDQHSLLEDQHHAKEPIQRAANISKDLKNLQVMIKKPIIAVSQQNRGSTEEESIIDLSHISMSDRIGQDATTVLFLTCKDNILNVFISKSRDAERDKKLSYAINWNTGSFDYIPEPDKSGINNSSSLPEIDDNEGNYY